MPQRPFKPAPLKPKEDLGYTMKHVLKDLSELKPKEQEFFLHLMREPTLDPGKAGQAIGFKGTGPGRRMAEDPKLQRMITFIQHRRLAKFEIQAQEVLMFLYNALTLDPLSLFDTESGVLKFKDLQTIPAEIRMLITELSVKSRPVGDEGQEETNIRIKWVSKELALQLCMKHLGLLTEKIDVRGSVDLNVVSALRDRLQNITPVIDGDVVARKIEQQALEMKEQREDDQS